MRLLSPLLDHAVMLIDGMGSQQPSPRLLEAVRIHPQPRAIETGGHFATIMNDASLPVALTITSTASPSA